MRDAPPDPSPSGALRVLFLGALTPRKGVLSLVRAFAAYFGVVKLAPQIAAGAWIIGLGLLLLTLLQRRNVNGVEPQP